tara:strand:+ start:2046 stop:2804 length:759 start_codon:yes stop_codon:yes gene_type:complete
MTEPSKSYQAPAVEKAFRLLRQVADADEPPRLSDLAGSLNISKGTAHGLIKALEAAGALTRNNETKRLSLGPAVVELALKDQTYLQLGALAQPVLDELQTRIGETVFFGLMHPWQALIMAVSEARNPMKISSRPGDTIPLLAGALGKLYLSLTDEKKAKRIIREKGLPAYTPASIRKEALYIKEVERVRETRVATDRGEYMAGVNALAVPAHASQPLALWVVGFAGSLNEAKMIEITDQVKATGERLSQDLD